MIDAIAWFFTNLGLAAYNILYAITHPTAWLNWGDPQALLTFVYYGASVELFFATLLIVLVLTAVGVWRRNFMWGMVRGLEGFSNFTGRLFAWAGLLMVLQQVVIVFVQRIFATTHLTFGIGTATTFEISWWAEELKLYNAMVVCMCCAYTFVQGGHVRVDLFYASMSFRTKRLMDMAGTMLFMIPSMLIIWFYSWFFLWRHLITPKVSASDTFDRLMAKSRVVRWNVETIAFSPNGFNAYFLFKVLMVAFAFMMLLQALAFLYRSYLEYSEGPESEAKYLDKDVLDSDAVPTH
ncbi:MAG: C4-dicarboxylate ABC transporter permease [Rhodobacteraceae bacterium]|nr:C4-dicarboxylate ABC transporter permease [Paracoccaceae bacterium]